jgi:hypothetical protein
MGECTTVRVHNGTIPSRSRPRDNARSRWHYSNKHVGVELARVGADMPSALLWSVRRYTPNDRNCEEPRRSILIREMSPIGSAIQV